MLYLWWYMLLGAGLIAGTLFLGSFDGKASIEFLGTIYQIHTGLLIGLMITVMAFGGYLFYWISRTVHGAFHLPDIMRRRGREKGWRALSDGLVALAAGDAHAAKIHARNAKTLMEVPHYSALLEAQIAQLEGNSIAARKHFATMLEDDSTKFLGLRGLIVQALKEGHKGEALVYARQAHEARSNSKWVIEQLVELEAYEGNWAESIKMVKLAGDEGIYDKDDKKRHLSALHMAQAISARDADDKKAALGHAKLALSEGDGGFVPAAVMAARLYMEEGKTKSSLSMFGKSGGAEGLIRSAWKVNPHPALAKIWMELSPLPDPKKRVEWAKKLIALNETGTAGHLMLADAYMAAKDFAASEQEITRAKNIENTRRVHHAMYRLMEARGASDSELRDQMARTAMAAPDPAWVCEDCGDISTQWRLFCADCGSFNSYQWRIPETPPLYEDMLELAHSTTPAAAADTASATDEMAGDSQTSTDAADTSNDLPIIDADDENQPKDAQKADA